MRESEMNVCEESLSNSLGSPLETDAAGSDYCDTLCKFCQ
jgi:hypothetical protein